MIHYFLQSLGGGSLIALVLLWFTNYYVEFIGADIYGGNCTL
ncbi:ASFV G ACD 00350 [African swine fever virus]